MRTKKLSVQSITIMAMLIALNIILARGLSLSLTEYMRISFGFLPTAVAGFLLGPVPAMIVGGVADVLGYLLKPTGPYHFGFTLTAILAGLTYGLLFYRRDVKLWHILLAKLLIDLCLNIGLNTLWVHQLYGKAILVLLPSRAYKNLFQYPVDVALLFATVTLLKRLPQSLKPPMK